MTSPTSANTGKWPEVTSHLLPLSVSGSIQAHLVNAAWFAKLAPQQQETMTEELRQMEKELWTLARTVNEDATNCSIGEEPCAPKPHGKVHDDARPGRASGPRRVRKISQEQVLDRMGNALRTRVSEVQVGVERHHRQGAQPDDPVGRSAVRTMYDERNPIARWAGPPVRWMQIACGWALMAICFATLYDIVARRLFGHSVQGVTEVGAYLLAIVSAFGFSVGAVAKGALACGLPVPRMPPLVVAVLDADGGRAARSGLAALSVRQGWHVLDESLLFGSRACKHAVADADVDPAGAVARGACGVRRRRTFGLRRPRH